MGWSKKVKPQEGDLIRVRRKVGYCHYGIALSENEVIHYAGPVDDEVLNAENIKIRRAPISIFIKEDEIEVKTPFDSPFTRNEVVSRAKEYVNSSQFRGQNYDFLMNNCEHFARYCYYGNPQSVQVGRALSGLLMRTIAFSQSLKKDKTKSTSNIVDVDCVDKEDK